MKYEMRLHNEPFELIKSGSKTIELRLNDEKEGNFKLEFIDKNIVLDILEKSLDNATREGVTLDTILVIKEYT